MRAEAWIIGLQWVFLLYFIGINTGYVTIGDFGSSGRKHEAGTALYDGEGELCGQARALWIEPRSGEPVT